MPAVVLPLTDTLWPNPPRGTAVGWVGGDARASPRPRPGQKPRTALLATLGEIIAPSQEPVWERSVERFHAPKRRNNRPLIRPDRCNYPNLKRYHGNQNRAMFLLFNLTWQPGKNESQFKGQVDKGVFQDLLWVVRVNGVA